jgi:hypothetical protein
VERLDEAPAPTLDFKEKPTVGSQACVVFSQGAYSLTEVKHRPSVF